VSDVRYAFRWLRRSALAVLVGAAALAHFVPARRALRVNLAAISRVTD